MKRYAIIDDNIETILLTDSNSHSPLRELLIENYELSEDLTVLKGDLVKHTFSSNMTDDDHEDEELSLDSFEKKSFLFWTWESRKTGWLELKKRERIVLKNPIGFKIVEVER